jgi:DNA-binding protein HU-beta
MNKSELVSAIAEHADLSKADAGKALDAVLDAITSALSKGDEVRLTGFGSFGITHRAATKGRNPSTGAEIDRAVSSVVERLVYTEDVGSSTLSPPTIFVSRCAPRGRTALHLRRRGACAGPRLRPSQAQFPIFLPTSGPRRRSRPNRPPRRSASRVRQTAREFDPLTAHHFFLMELA